MESSNLSTEEAQALLHSLVREQQRLRRQVRWLVLGLTLTLSLLALGESSRWWRARRQERLSQAAKSPIPPAPPAPVLPTQEPPAGEVRARRLLLTDEQGRLRAELGLAPGQQEPHLVFYRADGQRWATLAVSAPPGAEDREREPALILHDEAGSPLTFLGASEQGSGLLLYKPGPAAGLALYADSDFQGLTIFNGRTPRIHLHFDEHDDANAARLLFRNEQGKVEASLTGARGGASLKLHQPDGKATFSAP